MQLTVVAYKLNIKLYKMEDIYNKQQLIDLDLKKIEPVIFTKEELLHFANYYHIEQLRLGVVIRSLRVSEK